MTSRRRRRCALAFATAALVSLFLAAVACDNFGGLFGSRPPFTRIDAGLTAVTFPALAWADYDADGDMDLVVTGAIHNSVDHTWRSLTRLYRNDGNAFTEIDAGLPPAPDGSVAWGDYNCDGHLDLAVASASDAWVFRNDGNAFADIGAGLTGETCVAAWGDWDNDGDPDLVVGGKLYRNDQGVFYRYTLDPGCNLAAAWGDYGNDGRLDLALACMLYPFAMPTHEVWRNVDGTPWSFTASDLPTSTDHNSLAWGDYDGDGKLELALAGRDYSHPDRPCVCALLKHTGVLPGSWERVMGLRGVGAGSIAWGDYDNDGDLDLAQAGYEGPTDIFENAGGAFVRLRARLTHVGPAALAWADYDGDGDLDLLVAGEDANGRSYCTLYRNNCTRPNTPPEAPTDLSTTWTAEGLCFSWSAATDAETPSPGLTCNLRVGTAPGSEDVMPAHADLVTGKRRIPAMGNVQHNLSWTLDLDPSGTYYWSVQAVDTAFAGSAWAPEEVAYP